MSKAFVQNIHIKKVRHLEDFEIQLSQNSKKHLIITGKNGSGKTSLLIELKKMLAKISNRKSGNHDNEKQHLSKILKEKKAVESKLLKNIEKYQKKALETKLIRLKNNENNMRNRLKAFDGVNIKFSIDPPAVENLFEKGEYVIAFFGAERSAQVMITPGGIKKVSLKNKYDVSEYTGSQFIQYIVNLKADRSFARDDNDFDTVQKIDIWFKNFENMIGHIFDDKDIKLEFDRKNYDFKIIQEGKEPFNFNMLSDGYSAILNIVTELILRMELHKSKNYDIQGIVLIDEIETHLHVELQKKVLPFLTNFFPRIQFIVTTHSPFILSSLQNSVICDLEHRTVSEDFSGYSYDAIIEGYFNSDKYSETLKEKVIEYEKLTKVKNPDDKNMEKLTELKEYFDNLPVFLAPELAVKLQDIKLSTIDKGVM